MKTIEDKIKHIWDTIPGSVNWQDKHLLFMVWKVCDEQDISKGGVVVKRMTDPVSIHKVRQHIHRKEKKLMDEDPSYISKYLPDADILAIREERNQQMREVMRL